MTQKQSFTIHEFRQKHDDAKLISSGIFEPTGRKENLGYTLKQSARSELKRCGFTPFGNGNHKRNWPIAAWEKIEQMMDSGSAYPKVIFKHYEQKESNTKSITQILNEILSIVRELKSKI